MTSTLDSLSAIMAPQKPVQQQKSIPGKDDEFFHEPPSTDAMQELPPDMTWSMTTSESETVPVDWEEDGIIVRADAEDELDDMASEGDTVLIKLENKNIAPGEYMVAYHRGAIVKSATSESKLRMMQRSAILKVLSVDGSSAKAKVMTVSNALSKGDVVKKAAGKR